MIRRTALSQAYTAAGKTPPVSSYTDPGITVGQTGIKASHLNELRLNVGGLE